jgi:hypothetical protein
LRIREVGAVLSGRTFANVLKSFTNEADQAFRFLADEFGLSGPDHQVLLMPTVAFVGSGLRYSISLDSDDEVVLTQVERDMGEARLVADLPRLVWAAGLGKANQVPQNAHTLHNLRRSLESQAGFVRRLYSLMTSEDAVNLMLKAGARRWRT